MLFLTHVSDLKRELASVEEPRTKLCSFGAEMTMVLGCICESEEVDGFVSDSELDNITFLN